MITRCCERRRKEKFNNDHEEDNCVLEMHLDQKLLQQFIELHRQFSIVIDHEKHVKEHNEGILTLTIWHGNVARKTFLFCFHFHLMFAFHFAFNPLRASKVFFHVFPFAWNHFSYCRLLRAIYTVFFLLALIDGLI